MVLFTDCYFLNLECCNLKEQYQLQNYQASMKYRGCLTVWQQFYDNMRLI